MITLLENLLQKVLRVPPKPDPPFGTTASLQTFRAGRGYYRYRLAGWTLGQLVPIAGLLMGFVWLHNVDLDETLHTLLFGLEALTALYFLVLLPFSFLMLSLDYRYRWYMVSDNSLRIREGLLKVSEKTMTFSNIQNLSIHQGPIQRLFGISDLEVKTAGGGGGGGGRSGRQGQDPFADDLHSAYFRGVDNAAQIRDLVWSYLQRAGGAGLGDPDEPARHPIVTTPPSSADPATLAAAHQLLTEVKALRAEAAPR